MSKQEKTPQAVDCINRLQPYIPGKPIEELEREYGVTNAVKLASNENPLGPSPNVLSYLKTSLLKPLEFSRYPDGNGFVLKNKLVNFFSQYQLMPEQITLGNGSNDVLDIIARTFASIGDEVIFSQYAFAVYPIATQAVGANAVVTQAIDWGHDLRAMLDNITQQTRLIFIANPNNPTGTYLTFDELQQFIRQVPEHVVVVIDEAYDEYAVATSDGYASMLPVVKDFNNLIVTRTFSKAYGLASFRVGYAISSEQIADLLNRVRQPFNNNTLALESAAIALHDQEHILQCVQLNTQGMNYLTDGFHNLGLTYIPSSGNFVCLNVGSNCAEIYEKLMYEGVITRPVANYKMSDYLRISVGTMDENKRAMEALKKILA